MTDGSDLLIKANCSGPEQVELMMTNTPKIKSGSPKELPFAIVVGQSEMPPAQLRQRNYV